MGNEHSDVADSLEQLAFTNQQREYDALCRRFLERFNGTADPELVERLARACLLLPGSSENTRTAIACATAQNEDQLLAVNEALEKFAAQDKQKPELVKLRYYIGMTIEEAADVPGISTGTAKRHWAYARAWLAHEIETPAK